MLNGRRIQEAGRQSVGFWLAMFAGIVGSIGAVNTAINVYLVAPAMERRTHEVIQESIDRWDRHRSVEMGFLKEAIAEVKTELRRLDDRIK